MALSKKFLRAADEVVAAFDKMGFAVTSYGPGVSFHIKPDMRTQIVPEADWYHLDAKHLALFLSIMKK